jgi:hypothetical protein
MADEALAAIPSSANTMADAKEATVNSFINRMQRLSGGTSSGEGAETLRQGARQASEAFWTQERALRNQMLQDAGGVVVGPQDMPQAMRLLQDWDAAINRNPATNDYLLSARDELAELVDEAQNVGLPFGQLREKLTHITQSLQSPQAGTGYVGKAGQARRNMEKALRADAKNAVAQQAPQAAPSVQAYDRFVSSNLQPGLTGKTNADLLETIGKKETDQLLSWAMQGSQNGPNRIKSLRKMMPNDQWETISKAALQRMGKQPGGVEDFSVGTFTTNWRKMDDAARKSLFGDDYEFLKRMAKLGEDIKKVEQEANRSKTAQTLMLPQMLQMLASAGAGLGAGGEGAAAGALAGVVGPWAAARGMTSPGFSRFIAGGGIPGLQEVGGTLGRLALTPELQSMMALEQGRVQR